MRILLVDDNITNLSFLTKLVAKIGGCEAVTFSDPGDVLAAMPKLDFDLAVVDYQMPGYNGVELLREITMFEKYRGKPFVMVTADTDMATRMACLDAGSIDFLNKPVNPLEFQARMRNLIALVDARNKLADKAEWLRQEVDKATAEIREREEEIIDRLSIAASFKDIETARHTRRVGAYSEVIAEALGLTRRECADIKLASPMHDIGKVGIPDAVLLKKGKLTEQEFAEMQTHTLLGCDILRASKSSLLRLAAEIAATHHERWDGQGYPSRLSGIDIPIAGRIVALADNFDALTTARPYKHAWSVEEAVVHILSRSGSQFDPACVQAFEVALPQIIEIKVRFGEAPDEIMACFEDGGREVAA
ncbi:response regulator [Rhizobium sp. VS19-DR104.2]|uniref:response regulator n=1 Tax=unclassified Rhizobium TaxID=2613769 RepID=UPI001C5BE115|nr:MULTISPECIES: HD domain-containing phosphohydrolase [unclassified Rhizobium]MBZ5763450.1 response regulator [Rhizobium sp. VS19-DR96]MBZ5769389.1 response regulator [Rhizobium sp. VS19-DR129.2]MBZ5777235.1 response regulator [Rhizobium sp. VS19-DRK62.2]MBZ5788037.1 response regulator [Rhizobium sp. VS19-DR121]MBZ5805528.1 response regulator [Rhizobium sp. VS19-DR181]